MNTRSHVTPNESVSVCCRSPRTLSNCVATLTILAICILGVAAEVWGVTYQLNLRRLANTGGNPRADVRAVANSDIQVDTDQQEVKALAEANASDSGAMAHIDASAEALRPVGRAGIQGKADTTANVNLLADPGIAHTESGMFRPIASVITRYEILDNAQFPTPSTASLRLTFHIVAGGQIFNGDSNMSVACDAYVEEDDLFMFIIAIRNNTGGFDILGDLDGDGLLEIDETAPLENAQKFESFSVEIADPIGKHLRLSGEITELDPLPTDPPPAFAGDYVVSQGDDQGQTVRVYNADTTAFLEAEYP